ncbi:MAG: hypothetical protein QM785_19335 [Pyrinomonadaceae bacterium]
MSKKRDTGSANLRPAVLATLFLMASVIACGGRSEAAVETIKRGDLTINTYGPTAGIGHGDGTPGGCTFTYKGQPYGTPPMVKNGGKMFRCDVKPDSDDPVIRIAFYRPEDDWTCGTRFGAEKAKCLPDQYEAVGGILTIRNGELAFEDHGFWDVSYDWGEHSVKFKDGREFDYKNWKWSGCGPEPLKFVKSGVLTIASGQFCNSEDWHRVYFSGKELRPDGAGDHPFDSVGINQDSSLPSATAWIGNVKGFVYLSKSKPVYKEVGESPEFVDNGKAAKWWSADYQTRYTMQLATEVTTSETRKEVQDKLEKSEAEKNALKQTTPLLSTDDFGKFEIDYKDRHGQFYLGDLKKFDELKDIGFYPYSGKKLLAAADNSSVYFVFSMHNVTETSKQNDPCIGTFIDSVIWVRADLDMIARDARSQVVSSCLLDRKLIGEPKVVDGKLSVIYQDASGKHELNYDNANPDSRFRTR